MVGTHAAEPISVGAFSTFSPGAELPQAWRPLTFKKIPQHTRYALVADDGRTVLKAASEAAASGLIREIRIDPAAYPVLEWSWKVRNVLRKGDVTTRAGDDYPARVYVTFEYDASRLSWGERLKFKAYRLFYGRYPPTAAISYVWDSASPVGTRVPNAYTDRVEMIVVDSGRERVGQWASHRRNVYQDYVQRFGTAPPQISAVAVMTDTDNTGESAIAYYGDMRFLPANR